MSKRRGRQEGGKNAHQSGRDRCETSGDGETDAESRSAPRGILLRFCELTVRSSERAPGERERVKSADIKAPLSAETFKINPVALRNVLQASHF